ncbi:MAG: M20 family metallopeptidase [Oligosphaeraceae bacterium]|nr:M20 family metallopeptidase [Oligosphaeraceae bacterium]
MKNRLRKFREMAAAQEGTFRQLSSDIWSRPELGLQEHYACQRQVALLREFGFEVVSPFAGLETAFRAQWGSGEPIFAIVSEYDALPEIDHGCGHNLIAAAALLAGRLTQQMLQENSKPGQVLVLGTPGEESIGGKVLMLKHNCLAGVGAVMMVHPSSSSYRDFGSTAINRVNVEFFGKSVHAASTPEQGINALDAVIMLFNGVSYWRQQLPESARIHGIIENGGVRPNIIPDYASCYFFLRSPENETLEQMNLRFADMIEGAAKMTGCTYKSTPRAQPYKARKPNHPMNEHYAAAMQAQGLQLVENKAGRGSSDFGDFSQVCPGIHPYFSISDVDIPGHSKQLRDAANSDLGFKNMIAAAISMADIAYTYIVNPQFRQEIQADFAQ